MNFYYVLSRYNFRIFFRDFPNYSRAKESQNRVEFFVFFQVKLPDKRDKMTSRFQNSTPKFKIKDENFNDCVSISTNSSISSIKSYRASIKGWKILKTNCGVFESSALSFYRSQNILGWSKFFVPDQKVIYIFWQSQTFCARQKDDLHSVKLVFVPAQKCLKRH